MSVNIETVAFGDESKRLVLSNAQWGATITAGTSWNRIRIACRMAFSDSGGHHTGSPRLYLGMMSAPSAGMTNGPLSGASTGHFIGMMPEDATVTRLAGPPVSYQFSGNQAGIKVGATRTLATSNGDHRISGAESTPLRMIQHVEIEKGSPNFTIRASGAAITAVDHSKTLLIQTLEASTYTGANTLLAGYGNISTTIAVDESGDGFFNAICVGWDRTSSACHISEMFYAIYE